MSQTITIRMVAEEAGVSVGTVSAVLNGRLKEEWKGTADRANRVRDIAQKMGYRPHAGAKSLKTRRSFQAGVLIRNTANAPLHHLAGYEAILGMNQSMEDAGYNLCLVRIGDVRREANAQATGLHSRVFREHAVDGMLVMANIPADVEETIESLVPSCVWFDANRFGPMWCIRRDEYSAGRTVADAVVAGSYRHVVWLTYAGTDCHYSLDGRLSGARAVLDRAGIDVTVVATEQLVSMHERLDAMVPLISPDTAFVCYDVEIARWLLGACASRGWTAPRDLGMACCDYTSEIASNWPALSCVRVDRYEMGRLAGEMLMRRIQRPDEAVPSQLMVGQWHGGMTLRS